MPIPWARSAQCANAGLEVRCQSANHRSRPSTTRAACFSVSGFLCSACCALGCREAARAGVQATRTSLNFVRYINGACRSAGSRAVPIVGLPIPEPRCVRPAALPARRGVRERHPSGSHRLCDPRSPAALCGSASRARAASASSCGVMRPPVGCERRAMSAHACRS